MMAIRSMWLGMVVVAALAATAVGQPAGGSGAGSAAGSGAGSAAIAPQPDQPPVDARGQCVAQLRSDPAWFKEQCTAAIRDDKDWNAELFEQVRTWNANQLLDQSQAAHEADAKQIAKNKQHVIYAYAAMWLLAVGFLLFLWRRQQGLKTQIAELKRDLETAVKDAK